MLVDPTLGNPTTSAEDYDTIMALRKIPGPQNVADLGTKHLGHGGTVRMLRMCSIEFESGHHELALRT